MKKIIVLSLIVAFFGQQALAKESGGLQFWQGTGGLLIGAGVIYWIYSEAGNEDEIENKFSLYSKSNLIKKSIMNSLNEKYTEYDSIYAKYQFTENSRINSYGFIGINSQVINLVDDQLELKSQSTVGFGLHYSIDNSEELSIEFSTPTSITESNDSSLSINYNYSF